MAQIKISYDILDTKISELKTLRSSWKTKVKPTISGGGQTVTVADQVADAYIKLFDMACVLCDNSVSFLENIKNSVDTTDKGAANAMK